MGKGRKTSIPDQIQNESIQLHGEMYSFTTDELAIILSRLTELGHRYGVITASEIQTLLPVSGEGWSAWERFLERIEEFARAKYPNRR